MKKVEQDMQYKQGVHEKNAIDFDAIQKAKKEMLKQFFLAKDKAEKNGTLVAKHI